MSARCSVGKHVCVRVSYRKLGAAVRALGSGVADSALHPSLPSQCRRVCVPLRACHIALGAHRGQGNQVPLELDSQAIANHLTWVLGTEPGSSGRATGTLSSGAPSSPTKQLLQELVWSQGNYLPKATTP